MRRFLLTILLAGTAVSPALAQDRGDRENRDGVRAERHQAREDRQQAREQVRAERVAPQVVAPQVEARQQLQVQAQGRGGFDRQRFDRGDRGGNQSAALAAQQQAPRGIFGAQQRADESRGDFRQSDRAVPNVMRSRNPVIVDQNQQRVRTDGRRWSNSNWNTNWRNDRRYDWRNYRDRHRSTFHLGIYYDPFGYGYQPFNIGYRLYPNYYSQQYWIDPGMYQLPYPPPGTTWVRYWNDALLVDMYSGEVVDVIHNFFW